MVPFDDLTKLKTKLDSYRPIPPEMMEILDKKFKIDWTYNSNAIEGIPCHFKRRHSFFKKD